MGLGNPIGAKPAMAARGRILAVCDHCCTCLIDLWPSNASHQMPQLPLLLAERALLQPTAAGYRRDGIEGKTSFPSSIRCPFSRGVSAVVNLLEHASVSVSEQTHALNTAPC